jgi:hypothetical protein
MSIRNLSAAQMAQQVKDRGGASIYFKSGREVEGPGFMVSDYGSEETSKGATPDAGEISAFVDKHYDSASKDPEAAAGFWDDKLDVSRRVTGSGAEARRRSRENQQEAIYALPGQVLGDGRKPETIHRPYGTDILTNLGRTPKAEREAPRVVGVEGPRKRTTTQVPKRPDENTPIYRDMADPSVQANAAWARSANPNEFNLNEVSSDAWETTSRHNEPRARAKSNFTVERKESKRDNLGDVLRTINKGRVNEVRGKGLVAHPDKGWHPKDAGPSKVGRSTDTPASPDYSTLESERATPDRAFPYDFAQIERAKPDAQSPSDYAHEHVQSAVSLHEQMVAEHGHDYLKKFRARRGLRT